MARARRRRLGARGEGRRRRKARVPTCDYTTNKKRTDSPGKRNTARLLHNKRVEDGASSVYDSSHTSALLLGVRAPFRGVVAPGPSLFAAPLGRI